MPEDPAHPYLRRATLSGGLRVAVRVLTPADRPALASGFGHLSEESRYSRFLEPRPRLPTRELDLLVGGIVVDERLALALVWPRTSRADIVVGVGRAVRLPGRPEVADVAVTVADEIQGQGAGGLLMRTLADAAMDVGIAGFTAVLLPGNIASARMLARVGEIESDSVSQGEREMTVRLRPAPPGI